MRLTAVVTCLLVSSWAVVARGGVVLTRNAVLGTRSVATTADPGNRLITKAYHQSEAPTCGESSQNVLAVSVVEFIGSINSSPPVVVVKDPESNRSFAGRPGDTLPNGAVIIELDAEALVLEFGGRRHRIERTASTGTSKPATAPPKVGFPDSDSTYSGVEKAIRVMRQRIAAAFFQGPSSEIFHGEYFSPGIVRVGNQVLVSRAVLSEALSVAAPFGIFRDVRAVPRRSSTGGLELTMASVPQDSAIQAIGIRDGDTIAEINGSSIADLQALDETVTQIKTSDELTVGVRRGDKVDEIRIKVVDEPFAAPDTEVTTPLP